MEPLDNDAHIEQLIATHTRRLQKLEQQHAKLGLMAHPSISIEIEDTQQTIAALRATLSQPPGPARFEDLAECIARPDPHRGLILLVGPGRAGVNPMSQAAGSAIRHHRAGPPGGRLEHCWLLPSGVEELDPRKAQALRAEQKLRDSVEVARALQAECAAKGVEARIRPVGEAFNAQATYAIVRWIVASDLPDDLHARDVICDFTGGTKLMAAGLIMACGTQYAMQCMTLDAQKQSVAVLVQAYKEQGS